MSAENTDTPQQSERAALLALVDDRLEGALAQVNEQSRNAAALIAAAETTQQQTRAMVQGANSTLEKIHDLLVGGAATRAPGTATGADPGAGAAPDGDAGDDADHREETEPAAGSDGTVAEGEEPDSAAAGEDVDGMEAGGTVEETGETAGRAPAEVQEATEEGSAGADAGTETVDEAASAARDETAATEPDPDPRAEQVDPGKPADAADRSPPPRRSETEIARRLKQIEEKLVDGLPSRAAQKEILEAIGIIRTEQDAQNQVIAAAVALTPSAPAGDAGMPPAWEAFQEVMSRLDALARIIRPAPMEPKETLPLPVEAQTVPEPETPALPPPAPVVEVEEVREAVDVLLDAAARPRRAFARFAWVAILVVFLAAGALGVLLQQQYTLLDQPDGTNGWKDRVWELTGEEIARCIATSSARGGTCAVTVELADGP